MIAFRTSARLPQLDRRRSREPLHQASLPRKRRRVPFEQLSFPYLLSTGSTANIGASVGIAFANGDDSFELLMKRADTALYEAKQAGKGRFRFSTFDPAATGVAADRTLRP
jgi:predicted signal transduction protein with EAL and GGDEF domain